MRRLFLTMSLTLLFCACTKNDTPSALIPDMSGVRINLAFTCTHESDHLPALEPRSDSLFLYARYLEKRSGPRDFNDIARYYRIAAAHGHYKANHNLQLLISEGLASSPDPEKESIDLADQLIKADIPSGYYDIGTYLIQGYGLKQDEQMARRFERKAADLGNPDAQYDIAQLLAPVDVAPAIARQMLQCAADQGHAKAAYDLGDLSQVEQRYPVALEAFQKAVAAGSSVAALMLESSFTGVPPTDRLSYMAVSKDLERSARYKLIGAFIDANDGRNPKVPDIDKIVPLPPAKLPPWDGTFQWQKEQDAAVPPEKPSDELIDQIAKAKNLDPATGLPLAGLSSKTSDEDQPATVAERLPLGPLVITAEQCPEDRVLCAKLTERMDASVALTGECASHVQQRGTDV
jgi:TPR repeat protein